MMLAFTCRKETFCSSSSRFFALSLLSCICAIVDTSDQSMVIPSDPDLDDHDNDQNGQDDDDERCVIDTQVEIAIGQP